MSKINDNMPRTQKTKIKVLVGDLWLNWSYLLRIFTKNNHKIKAEILNDYLHKLFVKLIIAKIQTKEIEFNKNYAKIDSSHWEKYSKWYTWYKDNKISEQNNIDLYKESLYKIDLSQIFKDLSDDLVIGELIVFAIDLVNKYIVYNEKEHFNNDYTKIFIIFIERQLNKKIIVNTNSYNILKNEEYYANLHSFLEPIEKNDQYRIKRNSYSLKNVNWHRDVFLFYVLNKLLINLELMLNRPWTDLVVDFKGSISNNIYNENYVNFLEGNESNEDDRFSKFLYIDPNLMLDSNENLEIKSFILPFESIDLEDLQWSFNELKEFMYRDDSSFNNKINSKLNFVETNTNIDTINDEEITYYSKKISKEIEKNDVKNILISGEALSGKSSVLKLFLKNVKEKDYIKISFSDINKIESKEDKNNENIIEKSLVRQIMYQLDNNRFVGNTLVNKNKTLKRFIFLLISSFIASIFLVPLSLKSFYNFNFNLIELIAKTGENWNYNFGILFVSFILIWAVMLAIFYLTNNNLWRFKSIKFKGSEVNFNNDITFLDANVDVIVDVILQSNKKIIVFEDINKHKLETVFQKLFEMNSLLNLKEDDKKITFIYVVDSSVLTEEFKTRFFDTIIDVKNNFKDIDKEIISKKIIDKITFSKRKKIVKTDYPLFQKIKREEIKKIVDSYINYFLNWKEINIILNEISNFEVITKNLFIKEILEDNSLLKNNIDKINNFIIEDEDDLGNEHIKKFAESWKEIKKSIIFNPVKKELYETLQEFVNKTFYIPKNINSRYSSGKIADELSDNLIFGFSKNFSFYTVDKLVAKSLIRFTFFKYYLVFLISNKYLESDKNSNYLLDEENIRKLREIDAKIKDKNNYYSTIYSKNKYIFSRLLIKELLFLDEELMNTEIIDIFTSKKYNNKFKFILYFVFGKFDSDELNDKIFNLIEEKTKHAIKTFVKKHSLKLLNEYASTETKEDLIKNKIKTELSTEFKNLSNNKTNELLVQLIYDGYIMTNPDSYIIPSKIDYSLDNSSDTCFVIDHIFEHKINKSFLLRETKKCFHIDLEDIYDVFENIHLEFDKMDEYISEIQEFYNVWYEVNKNTKPLFKMKKLDYKINEKYDKLMLKNNRN
ncbi:hypothetical protein KQ876_00295 [Mycoplasma sp. CSL7491-lung]|uniref:YobI family P-loop NTPase n=1 Tax=Mycoplasma sp. CSL7491-lung TaxID=549718 RepID=UPI001C1129E6|nr:hypothetical protein [Mycoplasma sp. CSL7491-lung]MBU4692649.1 hypothetical protein [Mycoplasma sp. CSL7491-lung]